MKLTFNNWLRAGALACLIAGPVFLLISAGWALYVQSFLHSALHATGTITQLVPRHDTDGSGITYAPEFRFQTSTGQSVTVTSDTSTSPSPFRVGQSVDVLYNPAHAETARINTSTQLYLAPMLFGIAGAVVLLLGVLARLFVHAA